MNQAPYSEDIETINSQVVGVYSTYNRLKLRHGDSSSMNAVCLTVMIVTWMRYSAMMQMEKTPVRVWKPSMLLGRQLNKKCVAPG